MLVATHVLQFLNFFIYQILIQWLIMFSGIRQYNLDAPGIDDAGVKAFHLQSDTS